MTTHPIKMAAMDPSFLGAGDPGAVEAVCVRSAVETPMRIGSARPSRPGGELTLTEAFRDRGFLAADLDPLGLSPPAEVPELDPHRYGLDDRAGGLVARLRAVYCGSIGWEIGHVHDTTARQWLARAAEAPARRRSDAERQGILAMLVSTRAFEDGLRTRMPGGKLFGLGGAEAFNVLIDGLLGESARRGVEEVAIGGMHRGRFNLLVNVCGKPLPVLVAEILGAPAVPLGLGVSSDVAYHLGYSGSREFAGRQLRLSVSPHPSHLQIAPVVTQGRARAKQTRRGADGRRAVMALLLHSDASFSGQGLVAEMLQLSRLAPYDIGGTVHVVINNQIGFTTTPAEGRSARAATDIARLIESPVLHVNGDDPEAVLRVAEVAAGYHAVFGRDIVIDIVCYRRPGHNEIDEPRFTQPEMYVAIDARSPVDELYAAKLATEGIDTSLAAATRVGMEGAMREAFAAAKTYAVDRAGWFEGAWRGLRSGTLADMKAAVETGVDDARLRASGEKITCVPDGFSLDPKVEKFLAERRQSIVSGAGINWASAEALAFATLLAEGVSVRFGGQDSVRGAFSQRHLELHDQVSGARHSVLTECAANGAVAEVHNTPLIEHAVLAFEYGMSLADPHRLVVWEAQFGEFLNIAQPVFDQCIACGEDRWLRASGLVILLPHGIDGGGPDHSTGRPERLLAACAGANLAVVNASTPANYFHALRRQMLRPFRKPLVVLTPKALLRNRSCVSDLAAMGPGTGFVPVIGDDRAAGARRVVACAGKVFYELHAARADRGLAREIALVRIEELHPFPAEALARALAAHPGAELVWCEEEPENMGCFTHLDRKLEAAAGRPFRRVGRPAAATPAVGVKAWHEAEVRAFIDEALEESRIASSE